MNYATIKTHDIANGPGVRVSLFVSGCTHRCKGCFNSEAWDFEYGTPYDAEAEERIMNALSPDYIEGLSLLGGEPFEPRNIGTVADILEKFREKYPDKNVWCYTGYSYDADILTGKLGEKALKAIGYIDVLVDGEFVESLKNPNLQFRGSSNQRVIDVKKSLEADDIIQWERLNDL